MSIESVMPSNHLIVCHPLLLLPSIFPSSFLGRTFPGSPFFILGGQSIGASASASVLPMNIQDWFPLGWTDLISLKSYDQPREHIEKQRHYFANKGPSSQSYGFSRSHVWMCELDHKESWAAKNLCFWTVVLEKTLESPLDCKEIQPVYPKSWIYPEYSLEGLMLKLRLHYFGHLMGRTDSLEKTLMLGKVEGRKRRGRQRMRWLDGITELMKEYVQLVNDREIFYENINWKTSFF